MKLCTKVVLLTFVHRPIQNHQFLEYQHLSTTHEKHPLNVLGAAVKSQTDSFDILKSWLECEKTLQKSRSSNKKEMTAKEQVTAYQLTDSNCLLAHT